MKKKNLEVISKDSRLQYISQEVLNLFPEKAQWRERLRYTMLIWCDNKDALEIDQFCIEYNIPRRTLYSWRDKYPDIKETIDDVKLIIASRRRVYAMTKNIDGVYAHKNLHLYDPEWHEVNKYHADLKKPEENRNQSFQVIMDCWNSDCLAKKRENDLLNKKQ